MSGHSQQRQWGVKAFRGLNLRSHLLPPSLLNFVAGLLAGAGINLLTSVATGPSTVSGHKVIIDSVVWVVAAIFAAAAAHLSEGAERRADLRITERLEPEEKQAILRDESAQVAVKFWVLVMLTLLLSVLASTLVGQLGA